MYNFLQDTKILKIIEWLTVYLRLGIKVLLKIYTSFQNPSFMITVSACTKNINTGTGYGIDYDL